MELITFHLFFYYLLYFFVVFVVFFFQAEDGIRDWSVTGVQTCALPISMPEPLYVDREMWEKIVLNLLSNAFKHTFEGSITVRLRWRGDHAELQVADTGVGIAANEQARVFERFHRVKGAKSRTHEGTGIGLALIKELVGLHRGTVRVESREGAGSAFIVAIKSGCAHLPQGQIGKGRTLSSTATRAAAYA